MGGNLRLDPNGKMADIHTFECQQNFFLGLLFFIARKVQAILGCLEYLDEVCVHRAIDGFSRSLIWLEVWDTNNLPKLF